MTVENIFPFDSRIKKSHRNIKHGHKSIIVWFTGLSGSGKSTIASKVEEELFKRGYKSYLLDADNIRSGLNKGLGFSDEDRFENIRRAGEVAKLFVDAGVIVLATFISPKKKEREYVRNLVGSNEFLEIYVKCPISECEKRDIKGIYKKYRGGEIKNFIGLDVSFEEPNAPNLILNTDVINVEDSVRRVLDYLLEKIKIEESELNHYRLSHLEELEHESIYVIREAVAQFERPVLLFSGGKDSIVLLHLSIKAFAPTKLPFPIMHIDTGHNFPETIDFINKIVKDFDINLISKTVQESIDNGRVDEETGLNASRNALQTITLLDAINEFKFDVALGGGRRDEEKARAKERFFSHRDIFGQWDPKNQRPELWNLFNGKKNLNEHFRVFPLSNWTELDIWRYIHKEKLEIPEIYFSHKRKCFIRNNVIIPHSNYIYLKDDEIPFEMQVRFRTVGDMTCTGAVLSQAKTIIEIINEIASARIGERGSRADDKRSDTSMEDRKRGGYF